MTTDRTPDLDKQVLPQGAVRPATFVSKVFGALKERAWVTEVGDVNDGSEWLGTRWAHGRPFDYDKGHYFACSTIKGGSRALRNFEAAVVFVLDDLGAVGPPGTSSLSGAKTDIELEAVAPEWTYKLRSSKDNYQIGYRLKPVYDLGKWQRFLDAMKLHPLFGRSVKEGDAVHYFRLPSGKNTKPGRGNCDVILVEEDWSVEWDLDDLARAFGIDLTAPVSKAQGVSAGGEKVSVVTLQTILEALPNDKRFDARDDWMVVMHAGVGATDGDEDAKDLLVEWSRPHPSFDEAETRRVLDSMVVDNVKASASTLRKLVEERHGRESDLFRRLSARIAFDEENAPALDDATKAAAPPPASPATGDIFDILPTVIPDEGAISARDWLYGTAYIRCYVAGLVAPGGTGKTSLSFVEALSMVTAKDLLGVKPRKELKVLVWNGEDPLDELFRRFRAAMKHYGITNADLGGRLFVQSARKGEKLAVAKLVQGAVTVQRPQVDRIIAWVKKTGVDVIIIDPFIASHEVPENSNDAISAVVKEWGRVAEVAGVSVLLVHHLRKMDIASSEVTADDARGASAYRDALRVLRLVASMDKATALKHGLNARAHFRLVDGKANLAPAAAGDDWYRFVSVRLNNGVPFPTDGGAPVPDDEVGVVTKWSLPTGVNNVVDADVVRVQAAVSRGTFRRDVQSGAWVGRVVAHELGLDLGLNMSGDLLKQGDLTPKQATDRKKTRAIVADWIDKGHLKIVVRKDHDSKDREHVEVGEIPSENVTENPFSDPDPPPY